jgi:glycosyltransferase involved in cell wall biosynthesis
LNLNAGIKPAHTKPRNSGSTENDHQPNLRQEVQIMIEGHNIICFSNDWDGDPLSKKHIMLRLSRKNRVLWVNSLGNRNPSASVRDLKRVFKKVQDFSGGCREVAENIHTFSPLAIPFHGNAAARALNRHFVAWSVRRAYRRLGFKNPITWTFLPTSGEIVGALNEKLIVYHCVDEFSEFTGTDKNAILDMERDLLRKADQVLVSSGPLYETKKPHNPRTSMVTHGVDLDHFRKACDPKVVLPADIAGLGRPVIGFYGLVADWVDLNLIRFLAVSRPSWAFVLIGKVDTDISPIEGLANVHLLGRKPYSVLPSYCAGVDVAILPFVVNQLTFASNPLKLREYLAAGLPVVTTDIPEARRLGKHVRVGTTYDEFMAHIETCLAQGAGPQLSISNAMAGESWDAKVEEMSSLIQPLLS